MQAKRIGEFLSRLVPLTLHDVEEILNEQRVTNKRFGDIALSLGMCRPEDVWKAWSGQLSQSPKRIDLDAFGIDAQAVAHVAAETAKRLGVIPVRASRDEMIVATDEANLVAAMQALGPGVNVKAIFVLAEREQIDRAIAKYYPQTPHLPVPAEASGA